MIFCRPTILDIGLPAYETLPKANKVVEGLFQGLAARASGFAIAPLASLAPAIQFLYVVMMYIAIYPVGTLSCFLLSATETDVVDRS